MRSAVTPCGLRRCLNGNANLQLLCRGLQDEDDRRSKDMNEPPTSQQQEGLKDATLMGDDLGNSLDAWQMDVLHAETPVGLRGALQGEGMQGGYLPFSQARIVVPAKQSGGMSSSYDSPCCRAHHKIVSLEL